MKRWLKYASVLLGFVLSGERVSFAAENETKAATFAEQFQSIQKQFGETAYAYLNTNDAERKQISVRLDKLTLACLELAEKNPDDPQALDALVQVVSQEYWLENYSLHPDFGKDDPQAKAIELMLQHHLQSDKLGYACRLVQFCFRQECETFLRTVLEKSPHRDVQGTACLRLAQFLVNRREKIDLLKDQPELASRYEGLYGKDYIDRLRRQDRAEVIKEAESFCERADKEFGDLKVLYAGTVSEQVKTELFEIRNLSVGKTAPEIASEDQDGKSFKLSDYRGKIVLLYFWSEF